MTESTRDHDPELVKALREAADRRTPIADLVRIIQNKFGEGNWNMFTIIMYFSKAFGAPLGKLRDLEGAHCVGHTMYSDIEIDDLLQPAIQEGLKAQKEQG